MDTEFLHASDDYLQRRHEIALRLLAHCDKQEASLDASHENELRDQTMIALVKRDYKLAAELAQSLAAQHGKQLHILQRKEQLRIECDRLCSARSTLAQRQELLAKVPDTIEDPYFGGVGFYLEKRHETALKLVAALDAELLRVKPEDPQAGRLRVKREQLSIEVDTLLQAIQVYEEREELLGNAEEVLGESTPDTTSHLRRIIAYLDARSKVVLKLIASIDHQFKLNASKLDADSKARLEKQRTDLASELDDINESIAVQKEAEAELKACGLKSGTDPYHNKVTTYLQNKSDVALQLIAFLDQRLEMLNSPEQVVERQSLAAKRDALKQEADDMLAQIDRQATGQKLIEKAGV